MTTASAPLPGGTPSASRHVLWIGPSDGLELQLALRGLEAIVTVRHATTPDAAVCGGTCSDPSPVFAVLASDRPGRFSPADALLVSRRWPLMPIVSVASSLSDGRRRSGPLLAGMEEVPWHDLPGRSRWWLEARDRGLPTSLGLPAAARREDRLLATIGGMRRGHPPEAAVDLSVSAPRTEDLEGLCDLLASAGYRITSRHVGRPPPHDPAETVFWDVHDLAMDDVEWLRLLVANRPQLFVVILDGFPRGDTALAAMRAGAAAVLGRPVALEAVVGVLLGRV